MTDDILKLWMPVTKTASGEFIGILSDSSIDRDGEFMSKELLQDWSKNVSVKALVNHENKMEKWVGGWRNLKYIENDENGALIGEPWFFSEEANPLAQQVKRQVEESLLNGENAGISIGALPLEHIEKEIDGKSHKGYTKAELLEGTWVPIQSNRNALSFARMAKQFNIELAKPKECLNTEVNKMTEIKKDEIVTPSEEPKVDEVKKEEEVEEEEVVEEEVAEEVVKVDGQEIVDTLKAENANLKKQLDDLKQKAILKPTVEKATCSDTGNDEPLTVERMLKMRYRGGK